MFLNQSISDSFLFLQLLSNQTSEDKYIKGQTLMLFVVKVYLFKKFVNSCKFRLFLQPQGTLLASAVNLAPDKPPNTQLRNACFADPLSVPGFWLEWKSNHNIYISTVIDTKIKVLYSCCKDVKKIQKLAWKLGSERPRHSHAKPKEHQKLWDSQRKEM